MSAQAMTGPTAGREGDVNEVRLVGRVSATPEERVLPSGDVLWSFRVVVRATGGPPVAAARRRPRVHRVGPTRPALGHAVAARRRRRGRGRHPAPVLPRRRRRGVAGGGGGQLRSTGAACSERMSTPRLGLGWNDVAFSGSSRPRLTTRTTTSKSGAGISTPTAVGPAQGQGLLDGVVVRHLRGTAGSGRGPVEPFDRQQPPVRDVDRRPGVAVGRDQGPGGQGDERRTGLQAPRRRTPRPGAAASRSSSPTPRSVRWMAPRKSGGVVLVDQHRQSAVPAGAGVLVLQPQVGGVPVVAVGDEHGGRRELVVDQGDVGRGVGCATDRCCCSARSLKSRYGVVVTRRRTRSRTSAGPSCTRRIGAGFISISSIRSASSSTCTGWMPSWGQHRPVVEPRGPAGEVEGADEAADGETARGVLVEVQRRRRVLAQVPAALPLRQPAGDGPVGSREGAGRGRVPDPGGGQHHAPERGECQWLRDVRRRDHGGGEVHRSIVGAEEIRPVGG